MASNWYDDSNLVRGFADALTEAGLLESAEEFQSFFRKPQRYNEAYAEWENAGFPDSDSENWEDFVNAITEDSEEESENGESETE